MRDKMNIRMRRVGHINSLKETLKECDVPEIYISIYKYKEGSVCIEKGDQNWIVYIGERGKKCDVKSFKNIDTACKDIIQRCAESKEQLQQMLKLYENKLNLFEQKIIKLQYESKPLLKMNYKVGDIVYVIVNSQIIKAKVIRISGFLYTVQFNMNGLYSMKVKKDRLYPSVKEAILHGGRLARTSKPIRT